MMVKLRWFWTRLDANYWFYPALFVVAALTLAVVALSLDHRGYGAAIEAAGPPFAATPGSAHTMLQIIAGSMLSAAATVFSITIAAVAYASGTYGPRLLANFLEDKGNQFSLATLLGTFVYALTVLNSVRLGSDGRRCLCLRTAIVAAGGLFAHRAVGRGDSSICSTTFPRASASTCARRDWPAPAARYQRALS